MSLINRENYETYFIDYIDSLLLKQENKGLEQEIEGFLTQYPELREEFDCVLAFAREDKEALASSDAVYPLKEELKSIWPTKKKSGRSYILPFLYTAAACFLVLGLSMLAFRLYKTEEIKKEPHTQLITENKPIEAKIKMRENSENKEQESTQKIKHTQKQERTIKQENRQEIENIQKQENRQKREESSYIAALEMRLPVAAMTETIAASNYLPAPSADKQNAYLKNINEYISASIEEEKNSIKETIRRFFGSASRKYHKQKVEIENHFPSLFKSSEYYAFWEEKKENNK